METTKSYQSKPTMGSSLRRAQSTCRQSRLGSAQHGRISKTGCVHARAILVEGAMAAAKVWRIPVLSIRDPL